MKKITTLLKVGVFGCFLLTSQSIYSQSFYEYSKVVANDRLAGDNFGNSVSISGDYAIVGAHLNSTDINGTNVLTESGAAYMYMRNTNNTWTQIQKLVASDRNTSDWFGKTVSLSGNYAIIGANQEDEDASGLNFLGQAGSAYIFEKDGNGIWNEVQKIVAFDRASTDAFGEGVTISGDYAAVGAISEDHDAAGGGTTMSAAGAVYVYERDGSGVWNFVQKLVTSDRAGTDFFGRSVSISGNYLVAGADSENEDVNGLNSFNNAGSAYVFERNGLGVWNEVQKIVSSDRGANDTFGKHLAVSGSYLVVGAQSEAEDENGLNTLSGSGSAYVFERNGSGIWNQVQKIVASDRSGFVSFGYDVDISGNRIVVGAYLESKDEVGANNLPSAGASYVFERNTSGVWNEFQKIVASDRGTNDKFGSGVGIDGENIIIGAYLEDEDENQLNALTDAGSAYVFELCTPTTSTLTITSCDSFDLNGTSYTTTGIYTQMLANVEGCDSSITLDLTINSSSTSNLTEVACDSYDLNGTIYSATGSYTQVISNVQGCDSTITLNLTINSSSTNLINATACDSYDLNGTTYTNSGSYSQVLVNSIDCDSIITLDLIINNSSTNAITTTACDSYDLNGTTYTNSGTYLQTLTNSVGCDSIITLNLTINNSNSSSLVETACSSYDLNGTVYNTSGIFTQVIPNTQGCDSTITLDLTIITIDTSVTQSGASLTANDVNVSYQWVDCGNNYSALSGETNSIYTATTTGEYAVVLTNNNCVDTSSCYLVDFSSVSDNEGADFKIYPNPSIGTVNLKFGAFEESIKVSVYTVSGQIVFEELYFNTKNVTFNLEGETGVYFLRIKDKNGICSIKKIIKK